MNNVLNGTSWEYSNVLLEFVDNANFTVSVSVKYGIWETLFRGIYNINVNIVTVTITYGREWIDTEWGVLNPPLISTATITNRILDFDGGHSILSHYGVIYTKIRDKKYFH
ncbi:MAG: hypothetical protein LBV07_02325 [Syntrophobacterales bacterium]|jgi:hypothetical protein|nr:hypothetical protein [Syntrophobacterales bacterium]